MRRTNSRQFRGYSSSNKFYILCDSIKARNIKIHLTDDIENFGDYVEIFECLDSLTPRDSLTIYLNTPGGRCDVGFDIVDAIQEVPCSVDIVVKQPTSSMGAIIALAGDSLIMKPKTYLMFHDYSGGAYGKGEEVLDHTDNYRKFFKARFETICKPFLTKTEINKMFLGKDIYIHDDDPTLKARIKRHFKISSTEDKKNGKE